jgi:hypothetical protein
LGVRSSGTKMARVSASFGRAGILGSGLGNCWSCCFLVYCQKLFFRSVYWALLEMLWYVVSKHGRRTFVSKS